MLVITLLVICKYRYAKSQWVNQEIWRTFHIKETNNDV